MWLNVKASSSTLNSCVLSSRRTLYVKIWQTCVKEYIIFQGSIKWRNNKISQPIVLNYLIFTYLSHPKSNLNFIFCIEFWYNILVWILDLVEVVKHLYMLFMTRIKCLRITCFSIHPFQHKITSLSLLFSCFFFKRYKQKVSLVPHPITFQHKLHSNFYKLTILITNI